METMKQHLNRRGVDTENRSDLFVDEHNRVSTFFLYNLSGQIVGYQQYRPEGVKKIKQNPRDAKYYTYFTDNQYSVYGVDTLDRIKDGKPLIIVEGIMDAEPIRKLGYPVIAVLQNNPKPLMNFLFCIHAKKIAICDGDDAGRKLAEYADSAIVCKDGEDVNSIYTQDPENFLDNFENLLQNV